MSQSIIKDSLRWFTGSRKSRPAPATRRPAFALELLESRDLMDGSGVLGKLMVQLKAGATLPADHWGLTASRVQATGLPGWYEVTGTNLDDLSKRLTNDASVAKSSMSSLVSVSATPNDPNFLNTSLWGLNGANGIGAPAAWDTTTGSTRITVGIVDSGIDYTHPDLYKNIWINQAEIPTAVKNAIESNPAWDVDGDGLITFWDLNVPDNQGPGKITDLDGDGRITGNDILFPASSGGWANGVSEDGDQYVDDLVGWNFVANNNRPFDDFRHGTHIAGTIGAMSNNGLGVAGINWRVQLQAIKMLGSTGVGFDSDGGLGILYAAQHGARVSNSSWGTGEFNQVLAESVTAAAALNHLVVTAAGNSSSNLDLGPVYPASLPNANVLSVAATTITGALVSFSNYGATSIDLAAPGEGIVSTVPGGYMGLSGTSMASPHAAGAAALILSQAPTMSAVDLKEFLLSRVTPHSSLAGKTVSGGALNLSTVFTQGAEISIRDGDVSLTDNLSTVNFGTTYLGAPVSKTLTVKNVGIQTLTLGALAVATGFTLLSGLTATTLAPGQSTTFVIGLPATTRATFAGVLTLANSDASEGSFRLNLTGVVANRAPVVAPIANQTISIAQASYQVPASVSDADGDVLTLSGAIMTEAYYLDQFYGLYAQSSYFLNYWGLQEKWLYGTGGASFFILPDGSFYRQTPGAAGGNGTLLGKFGPSVYVDPSLLFNAPNNGGTASSPGGKIVVTPAPGFVGRLIVTVSASDGFATTTVTFTLTVANATPVVAAIGNQTMIAGQLNKTVAFSATDSDGQALTTTVTVWTEAYAFDQQYGLYAQSSYFLNYWGRQEKWIYGNAGTSFFILPDGSFYRQAPGTAGGTGTLLGNFGTNAYLDPSLLHNAPNNGGTAVVSGNRIVITPAAGFVGRLIVTVTASDGFASGSASFTLTVANTPPVVAAIANQTMTVGQGSKTVPFSASDADGQPLTFSATVATEAYALDQQLGLFAQSSYYLNYWGRQEKWIYGSGGTSFFLLPDGGFYRQTAGADGGVGTLVASLGASYYLDPSLLHNASPTGGPGSAAISGGNVIVTPNPGFAGKLYVVVAASDGFATGSTFFQLTVTNAPPVVGPIANQTIGVGQGSRSVPFTASDPEGQPLTFSTTVTTEAYNLKLQYGLYAQSSYFVNYWGRQEKWIYGLGGASFFILPDGSVYRQTPGAAGGTGTLIASLGAVYYQDPSLLHNASATAPGSAVVSGGNVIVTPNAVFAGKLFVTVIASDGASTGSATFQLTVTNTPPVVSPIANQTLPPGQTSVSLPFSATDADGQALAYSAAVVTEAYSLDQQYGLFAQSSYYLNYWGRQEKWVYGSGGASFFILPDGRFYRQTPGAAGGNGTLLATLDVSYYNDPSLLHNATNAGVTASIVGNQVVVSRTSPTIGRLIVTVSANDGFTSASTSFFVG